MAFEDMGIRARSLLRRAGLGNVPAAAVACIGILCIALAAFALASFWPSSQGSEEFTTTAGGQVVEGEGATGSSGATGAAAGSQSASSSAAAGTAPVVVDVEGAVKRPGVYELSADARVADAVESAGGFSKAASRASVNLAQKLADGSQVYVPTRREAGASASASAGAGAGSPSSVAGDGAGQGKVNINTASSEELQKLSGIGPALAERIIDYRESNGGFSSIEDLKKVSGIGDARFGQLEDDVCV